MHSTSIRIEFHTVLQIIVNTTDALCFKHSLVLLS